MTLYHMLNSENEEVAKLGKTILKLQKECCHEFGKEWQQYNIYYQRCKKCAYLKSTEY